MVHNPWPWFQIQISNGGLEALKGNRVLLIWWDISIKYLKITHMGLMNIIYLNESLQGNEPTHGVSS